MYSFIRILQMRRRSAAFTWFVAIFLFAIFVLIGATVIITAIDLSYDKRIGEGLSLFGEAFKGTVIGLSLPFLSSPCNDFDPCSIDTVHVDYHCEHKPAMNGYNCSTEDICYYPSSTPEEALLYPKYCLNGVCISNRTRCIGVCPSNGVQIDNASTCSLSMFPLNYDLFQNVSLSCVYGVCTLLTIQSGPHAKPLNDNELYTLPHGTLNLINAFIKCIQHDCATVDTNGTVLCVFSHICATYDFEGESSESAQNNGLLHRRSFQSESDLKLKVATIRSKNDKSSISKHSFPRFGQYVPQRVHSLINSQLDEFMETFNPKL